MDRSAIEDTILRYIYNILSAIKIRLPVYSEFVKTIIDHSMFTIFFSILKLINYSITKFVELVRFTQSKTFLKDLLRLSKNLTANGIKIFLRTVNISALLVAVLLVILYNIFKYGKIFFDIVNMKTKPEDSEDTLGVLDILKSHLYVSSGVLSDVFDSLYNFSNMLLNLIQGVSSIISKGVDFIDIELNQTIPGVVKPI